MHWSSTNFTNKIKMRHYCFVRSMDIQQPQPKPRSRKPIILHLPIYALHILLKNLTCQPKLLIVFSLNRNSTKNSKHLTVFSTQTAASFIFPRTIPWNLAIFVEFLFEDMATLSTKKVLVIDIWGILKQGGKYKRFTYTYCVRDCLKTCDI